MKKPLIIYVSGAPGSGKTTLAKQIAEEFQLLRISNDLINGGLRLTSGGQSDRKFGFDEVFIPTLVNMSEKGVSLVVDHVLQKGMSEQDVIEKLVSVAEVVYIHTQAENSIDRYMERELSRQDRAVYLTQTETLERAAFHRTNLERTQEALELGVPTLVVKTDNGYQPEVKEIFEFIVSSYKGSKDATTN